MSCLANLFVRRGNWRLALGMLEAVGEDQCCPAVRLGDATEAVPVVAGPNVEGGEAKGTEVGKEAEDEEEATAAFRVELLSRIGRVFLQFGALEDAQVYFRRANQASGVRQDNPRVSQSVPGGGAQQHSL